LYVRELTQRAAHAALDLMIGMHRNGGAVHNPRPAILGKVELGRCPHRRPGRGGSIHIHDLSFEPRDGVARKWAKMDIE